MARGVLSEEPRSDEGPNRRWSRSRSDAPLSSYFLSRAGYFRGKDRRMVGDFQRSLQHHTRGGVAWDDQRVGLQNGQDGRQYGRRVGRASISGTRLTSTSGMSPGFGPTRCTARGGMPKDQPRWSECRASVKASVPPRRRKPLHRVLDNLPVHKTRAVRDCIDSRCGQLILHVLPGYAPDLNPDERVWS